LSRRSTTLGERAYDTQDPRRHIFEKSLHRLITDEHVTRQQLLHEAAYQLLLKFLVRSSWPMRSSDFDLRAVASVAPAEDSASELIEVDARVLDTSLTVDAAFRAKWHPSFECILVGSSEREERLQIAERALLERMALLAEHLPAMEASLRLRVVRSESSQFAQLQNLWDAASGQLQKQLEAKAVYEAFARSRPTASTAEATARYAWQRRDVVMSDVLLAQQQVPASTTADGSTSAGVSSTPVALRPHRPLPSGGAVSAPATPMRHEGVFMTAKARAAAVIGGVAARRPSAADLQIQGPTTAAPLTDDEFRASSSGTGTVAPVDVAGYNPATPTTGRALRPTPPPSPVAEGRYRATVSGGSRTPAPAPPAVESSATPVQNGAALRQRQHASHGGLD
jgi:hypothetical protein